jgi:hypothetical protein
MCADETVIAIAERLYDVHSREDDPEGWAFPPITLGDVLVIGDVAVGITEAGVEVVEYDTADVISEADWLAFLCPTLARFRRSIRTPGCQRR